MVRLVVERHMDRGPRYVRRRRRGRGDDAGDPHTDTFDQSCLADLLLVFAVALTLFEEHILVP